MPKYTLLIAPSQAQGWREQVAAVEELFDFVAAVWIDPAGLAELFDSEMAVWIDPVAGERNLADNRQEFQGLAIDPRIKVLYIEGRLKFDSWEDKNGGGKRSKLSVVIENFQFLGGRDGGELPDFRQRLFSHHAVARRRSQWRGLR